eukprot:621659-Rhodomonas_salina.2
MVAYGAFAGAGRRGAHCVQRRGAERVGENGGGGGDKAGRWGASGGGEEEEEERRCARAASLADARRRGGRGACQVARRQASR